MAMHLSHIADRISAAVGLSLSALIILHQVFGLEWAAAPSRVAALLLMLSVLHRFGLREWALLALASLLAFGLWHKGAVAAITFALAQGAFFAGFILMMMLLREAAQTSVSVLKVGAWITQQPPGRRYFSNWGAGQLAGILLNFGAISLLAPLIQRGVRAAPMETEADRARALIRERRQLSALVRGFAPVITWAPTTLTQVIILGSVPGLDPRLAVAYGLGLGAVMLVLGWTEDRLRWGRARVQTADPGPFPRRAGLDLLAVYLLLVLGAWAVLAIAGVSLPKALMTVAPVMLIGWVLSQNHGALTPSAERLAQIVREAVPRLARDAYTLGAAGFIGIAAARLAPVEALAAWTENAHLAPWMIVALIPLVITLGGQIALSPMMMVVFLAAVMSALPALPAAPEHIAIALAAGWMLSLTASPNATGALLISGATGIAPTTITWKWNGAYSLSALTVFAVLSYLMV